MYTQKSSKLLVDNTVWLLSKNVIFVIIRLEK